MHALDLARPGRAMVPLEPATQSTSHTIYAHLSHNTRISRAHIAHTTNAVILEYSSQRISFRIGPASFIGDSRVTSHQSNAQIVSNTKFAAFNVFNACQENKNTKTRGAHNLWRGSEEVLRMSQRDIARSNPAGEGHHQCNDDSDNYMQLMQ